MRVRLFHGSFHDVDSDSLSFELAARLGFRSRPESLASNPGAHYGVEVLTPDEFTGSVTGDLNRRRAL